MVGGALDRIRARLRRGTSEPPRQPLNDGATRPALLEGGPAWDRPLTIESAFNLEIAAHPDGLRMRTRRADPQLLLLVGGVGGAPAGPGLFWVRFARGQDTLAEPAIYLDRGEGFTGESERRLVSLGTDVLGAKIGETRGLVRVRFDPSLSSCDAVASAIGLTVYGDGAEALGSPILTAAYVIGASGINVGADGQSLSFETCEASFDLALAGESQTGMFTVLEIEAAFSTQPAQMSFEVVRNDGCERYEVPAGQDGERWTLVLFSPSEVARVRVHPGCGGSGTVRSITVRTPIADEYRAWFGDAAAAGVLEAVSGRLDPSDLRAVLAEAARLAMFGGGDLSILRGFAEELHGRRWNRDWTQLNDSERAAVVEHGARLPHRPLLSVLMPVYNTPPALLRAAVESVQAQVYDRWELCIADDASTDPAVEVTLDALVAGDARIKVVRRERNGHISAASNSALELVSGEWTALLDHDDLLTPDALLAVAETINDHPDAQLIYSDEDKIDEAGERSEPFRKPQFSPALFRSQNYLNHLTVHRTANVRAVGGWREGYEGGQDHDLSLRVLEQIDPRTVRHIPRVLYHWRITPGSTAISAGEKAYAFLAGLRALEDHLQRTGADAHVEKQPGYPYYRIRYAPPSPAPLVSLLIPTRDKAEVLELAVTSILDKTEYLPFEIVVIDNGSVEPETAALFQRLSADARVRVIAYEAPFNFSAINNFGAQHACGEILGLVNNDVEVINSDWLTEMVSWAAQADIGCVGAKLYYGDDTIQHAGVVLGIGGVAGHGHKRLPRNHPGYFSRAVLAHDVSAVTGACLLVRRSVFEEVGGLDEVNLAVAFNDVDFCMKVRAAGYRNIFTPYAELYHHESVSRGAEDTPEKQARFSREVRYMLKRWGPALRSDPFYSPHLTLDYEDFSARPLGLAD